MNTTSTMKDIPLTERPYELLESQGSEKLTDAQLLAVFLRSGTPGEKALDLAFRLLNEQEDPERALPLLFQRSLKELRQIKGIGRVKAIQMKAVLELSRRLSYHSARERFSCSDPESVAALYQERLHGMTVEVSYAVYLNTKLEFMFEQKLGEGILNFSLVDIRKIMLTGYDKGAAFFILVHNHPSGNPSPSLTDLELTQKVREASLIMGMPLLDHIIVGDGTFVSFRNEDLLPKEGES